MAAVEKAPAPQTEKVATDTGSFVDDKKHASSDADSVLENSEGVTEHELATLRHVRDKMPWQAFSVAAVEFAERWVSPRPCIISRNGRTHYTEMKRRTTGLRISTTTISARRSRQAPGTARCCRRIGRLVLRARWAWARKSRLPSGLCVPSLNLRFQIDG